MSQNTDEGGKRSIQETSFEEDSSSKKQNVGMHADTPPWAMELLRGQQEAATGRMELIQGQNEIRGSIAELNASLQALQVDVGRQGSQINELDSKVAINVDRLERMERMIEEVRTENDQFRSDNEDLRGELRDMQDDLDGTKGLLNKQIDGGLRNHIVFHGIAKASNERHWDWEHTTKLLSQWLADNSDKDSHYYDSAIERAHRGSGNPEKSGPPPIHCKLRWRVAAQIRDLFIKKGHKIGNVTIKDMFSQATQDRVNTAMVYRKQLRGAEGGKELKLKVDYPARLMVKAPGENKYSLKKAF